MKAYENTIPSSTELEQEIENILSYSTYSNKKKIDELLFINTCLRSQLGRDSSAKDRENVDKLCRIIYRGIKKVDTYLGGSFLRTQDGSSSEPATE